MSWGWSRAEKREDSHSYKSGLIANYYMLVRKEIYKLLCEIYLKQNRLLPEYTGGTICDGTVFVRSQIESCLNNFFLLKLLSNHDKNAHVLW